MIKPMYYKLEIEDLVFGLIYEFEHEEGKWISARISDSDHYARLVRAVHNGGWNYRIKHLDRQDILDLGWEPYYPNMKVDRHFILNEFHLYFIQNHEEPDRSIITLKDATGVTVNIAENSMSLFQGMVKNKNRLALVMEMVGITEA